MTTEGRDLILSNSLFLFMGKITTFLSSLETGRDFNHAALFLLSASAVLRKEKELREILLLLKKKKFKQKKIYEALLQTYLFAGYPSAIISLQINSEYFRTDKKVTEKQDTKHFTERGEVNCRKIYGDKYDKLLGNISSFSPELSAWLVTEGYGKVLGRKGLSLREREICSIAVLTALKFESQLYSHINGGHRTGLHWKEIEAAIDSLALLNKNDCVKFGRKVLSSFVKRKGA